MRKRAISMSIGLLMACCVLQAMAAGGADNQADSIAYPAAQAGRTLAFPRDHGAHPRYRTEWWYVTGWVEHDGIERGFQITFFRTRSGVQEDNDSAFAPKQLLFAHAAIADARRGRLLHDQRVAREGFDLAYARTSTTDVAIDRWKLVRVDDQYHARILADNFALDLRLTPTQPVLLQGQDGFSRKGPAPDQASHYYSLPQLQVEGSIRIDGATAVVKGEAWLDHEWSSEYLPAAAQGWDWLSVNFADGGALMAFRMRATNGGLLWAGGSVRDRHGKLTILEPGDVVFEPGRVWRSPRTGVGYPVAMRVRAGRHELEIEPLMDDQELDSSVSTGVIYWEGAVRAKVDGKMVGRGYLELTGYADRPEM
jgi:predicted secreted hydrolase